MYRPNEESTRKMVNTRQKIDDDGLTGYQRYGPKISQHKLTIAENGKTDAENSAQKRIHLFSTESTGWWCHKDIGCFAFIDPLIEILGMSKTQCITACKNPNKVISLNSYVQSTYLKQYEKEAVVGKTWSCLGFSYTPRESHNSINKTVRMKRGWKYILYNGVQYDTIESLSRDTNIGMNVIRRLIKCEFQ